MDSSRVLPTGVVTFLLTDIEGSTRLWEAEPEAMREALVRHDSIVTACVRRLNGYVVKSKGEGDSAFAVFRHARDAITAALVLQCALTAEKWPTSRPIRVRMAIHTGPIELRDGDYYGPTVNRCARLRAMAHGGQVLISGAAATLTQGQLPAGASLHDLGSHQLKDLSTPERVWQLAHPRLSVREAPAEEPRFVAPAAPTGRAYLLTDHLNHDPSGREWGERSSHAASGIGPDGSDDRIRCYATPTLAGLLNGVQRGFRLPRLWEVTVETDSPPGSAVLLCTRVSVVRQATLPTLTGLHYARFAVVCSRAAYEGARYEMEFNDWATCWLAGEDSSGTLARELADSLERDARQDGGYTALPQPLMLANAARAAMHASKLSWLAGRARDEESARAVACAAEVFEIAGRLAHLPLLELAAEATPAAQSGVSPVAAAVRRPTGSVSTNRILRALPT